MNLRTRIPAPPLDQSVDLIWLQEGLDDRDRDPGARERLLPTGTVELVIRLVDEPTRVYGGPDGGEARSFRGPIVCGAHSGAFVIESAQKSATLGVHFRPGGAFPFLGVPVGDLRDAHAPLDALWGRWADDLRDRLLAAATTEDRFDLVEHALRERARATRARHPAVAFALGRFLERPGACSVAEVAGALGVSHRRFVRAFEDEVGLTPKLFCRVLRFQHALDRAGAGRRVDWARLALDCGYYDQAHLNRDFRAFAGLSPTAYLARRTDHRNHVPLGDPA